MKNTTETFIETTFLAHPNSVGETYFEHFKVSGSFFVVLMGLALAALIHAFIPRLFEKTVSQRIIKMADGMTSRNPTTQ